MYKRLCPTCGKELSYINEKSYKDSILANNLCRSCSAKNRIPRHIIIKKCKICNNEFECSDNSSQIYCSNTCRSNDIILNKKISNAIIKTNIYKYGKNSSSQLKETQNKMKNTNIKKYGYDYIFFFPDFVEQSKFIKKDKYGDENYNNSDKNKQTCINKYGVDTVLKLDDVRQKRIHKSKEDVYDKLFCYPFTSYVIPLFKFEEYVDVKTSYKFKCVNCGNTFYDNLDNGHIPKCKICYNNKSIFQNQIYEYISKLYSGIILQNDKTICNGLELDIYIPEKNIAIECDGNYWHSELNGKDKQYHLNKTNLCQNNNIKLLHILEDEWYNKKHIVESKLKHIFGKSTERIYARNCNIVELTSTDKNEFLNKYHIQGSDMSAIKLGLVYKGEIISVMTFGKRRVALGKKSSGEGEYELLRYCSSKSSVGGAGKLLSHFIKNNYVTKIISYADRRWSDGNLYSKIGFTKVSDGSPNYWYVHTKNYLKRYHRFNFRKDILNRRLELYDDTLTEWENMQLNGYDRIWDCGNLKYELILKNE